MPGSTTSGWAPEYAAAASRLLDREGVESSQWWLYGLILVSITLAFRLLGIVLLSIRAARSAGE